MVRRWLDSNPLANPSGLDYATCGSSEGHPTKGVTPKFEPQTSSAVVSRFTKNIKLQCLIPERLLLRIISYGYSKWPPFQCAVHCVRLANKLVQCANLWGSEYDRVNTWFLTIYVLIASSVFLSKEIIWSSPPTTFVQPSSRETLIKSRRLSVSGASLRSSEAWKIGWVVRRKRSSPWQSNYKEWPALYWQC